MRRLVTSSCALRRCLAARSAPRRRGARPPQRVSWAQPEIRAVVAHGLMAQDRRGLPARRPAHPGRARRPRRRPRPKQPAARARRPAAPVTIAQLDAALVRALGSRRRAAAFADGRAPPASRRPPASAPRSSRGCSACARTTRRAGRRSSCCPSDPATRAEAAYSAAQILALRRLGARSASTTRPRRSSSRTLTPWQRRILQHRRHASSATPTSGAARARSPRRRSASRPGRLRLLGLRLARLQAAGLRRRRARSPRPPGRTTYADERRGAEARSGSRSRSSRPATSSSSAPRRRARSPPQVDHMGIYLGNGWFIHSSGYGVASRR